MAINGSSTDAQVQKEYDDNASYLENNSVEQAKRFITAILILLRRMASQATKGSNQITFRPDLLERQLKEARMWLQARDDSYNVRPDAKRVDFRNFRRPPIS